MREQDKLPDSNVEYVWYVLGHNYKDEKPWWIEVSRHYSVKEAKEVRKEYEEKDSSYKHKLVLVKEEFKQSIIIKQEGAGVWLNDCTIGMRPPRRIQAGDKFEWETP